MGAFPRCVPLQLWRHTDADARFIDHGLTAHDQPIPAIAAGEAV